MITYVPPAIANQFQEEFEKVAARLAHEYSGRGMALPMEVVLLQVPISELSAAVRDYYDDGGQGGSAAIVAFHTDIHSIIYLDEEETLVEIDYLATREQGAER